MGKAKAGTKIIDLFIQGAYYINVFIKIVIVNSQRKT